MKNKKSQAKGSAATKGSPDLVCTTNTTSDSVVDAKVAKPVTVTFRFFPAMASDAIHLDEGKKLREDSKSLNGLPVIMGYVAGGTIASCTGDTIRRLPAPTEVSVKPKGKAKDGITARKNVTVKCHIMRVKEVRSGKTFGLLLGVDTKKNYRKHPLFQVTPNDNHVVVDVYETYGKHSDGGTMTLKETKEENGQKTDYYEAKLTGDVWKQFSHPYTASDVDTMLDTDLPDKGKQAIKDIYDGKLKQVNGALSYEVKLDDDKTILLKWSGGTENASNNITSLDIKSELLTRVQPNTYGALLKAAIDAEVDEVTITSGWRPMLGSAAHRLGLGLDVTYVKQNGKNHHLYRNQGTMSTDEKAASKEVVDKQSELAAARKAKKSKDEIAELEKGLATAKTKLAKAVDAAQAKPIKDFRKTLLNLKKIKQVIDPWYIDKDAGDKVDPEINMLGQDKTKSKDEINTETGHHHHLHITVTDVELGMVRSKQ